jgi:hypothetical protein
MKSPVRFQAGGPLTVKFSQATIVAGTMLAAWVLWLAANNKLLTYWNILLGRGASGAGAQAPNTVVNAPVSTTGQPTTGTASGTVTPIVQTPSGVAAGGLTVPGMFGP